jgi:hypothetical protein
MDFSSIPLLAGAFTPYISVDDETSLIMRISFYLAFGHL